MCNLREKKVNSSKSSFLNSKAAHIVFKKQDFDFWKTVFATFHSIKCFVFTWSYFKIQFYSYFQNLGYKLNKSFKN